ncbi:RNA polymerase primary sigma factor [Sesbania bispinosa]|nr:RNA polymerase primary sigma factor [Sesbania bispinosa]
MEKPTMSRNPKSTFIVLHTAANHGCSGSITAVVKPTRASISVELRERHLREFQPRRAATPVIKLSG